jgi:protein-tyrosine-phosphatase
MMRDMMRRDRVRVHAALGDEARLMMVEALAEGDRSVQELGTLVDLPGNLLAHHLGVLEEAGLIERRVSEGDRRRRYIVLRTGVFADLLPQGVVARGTVLFVCSHNSARSQFAAARWSQRTGLPAESAGRDPAERVNPTAVRLAAEVGLDLSAAVPRGYEEVDTSVDLVVSVCDRARESELPDVARHVHWSIPDPVRVGRVGAFREAFAEIDARIEGLAAGLG